jgi:hypothetical protein
LIDALSFIALGHVFTANMTGNITPASPLLGCKAFGCEIGRISPGVHGRGVFGGLINVRFGLEARLLKQAIAIEAALLLVANLRCHHRKQSNQLECSVWPYRPYRSRNGFRNAGEKTRSAGFDHYRSR